MYSSYMHSFRFYSHSKQHCGENYKMSNPCLIYVHGEGIESAGIERLLEVLSYQMWYKR